MAARAFQEACWASEDDGGALWGKSLYGPMIFVDPVTREVAANQPDAEGVLKPKDGIWSGKLPPSVGVANTATRWAGVTWTMLVWPLPPAPAHRVELMMHECWHRIQAEAGFPSPEKPQANAHLDTREGRIWIRLEWQALAVALASLNDQEERAAISDALVFRAWRRGLFPLAAVQEDRMEMHEGLAEYTGVRRMGLGFGSRHSHLAGRLKAALLSRPSFPMSFAYETGPAYGLLLDSTGKLWRSTLNTGSSLSETLRRLHGITLPGDLETAVRVRAKVYGGEGIIQEETTREKAHLESEARYRKMLLEGPTLELPIPNGNYTYDPNEVFPLGGDGSVLPESHIADTWGVLEVKEGVRLNAVRDKAFVSAPVSASQLKTSQWKLTLTPGWKVVPGIRKGDFIVTRIP
jgi:hypothetical protein